MISSKFAAFLHYTFSEQDLWMAASEHLHYNKKHTVSCFLSLPTVIIHQFHSYTKILTIIPFIPTPQFPVFPPWIPAFITFPPWFLSSPPWSPYSHPDPPHSHPDSPRSQPYSPHFHSAWFTSFSPWFDAFPSFPSFRSLIPHSGLYR